MHNSRNPAVKRLMREAMDLATPTELYHAQPMEDNLFEWHFTIRGPADSEFEGGVYHGRVLIPSEYPMKPPNIILLTPNGRFEINKKICLSISGYHPETWRPAWSIRTALLALIGFMPTHGLGAIGSLEYPAEERRKLARLSREWRCPACGPGLDLDALLMPMSAASAQETEEARALAKEISMTGEKPKQPDGEGEAASAVAASASAPVLTDLDAAGSVRHRHPQPPPPPAMHATPPMSFQDWLVRVKGYSEARARQLVHDSPAAAASATSQQASPPTRARADTAASVLRDEWGTVAALIFVGLAIAFLLARRSVVSAGGFESNY